jgi:cell division protein FtsA
MGAVLIDIGGGTTELSFFENGSILYTTVLPIGGEYITKDLAIVLRTSIEEAARIKEAKGLASPDMARDDMMINVRNIQGKDMKQVSQQVVAEIINARIVELMEMIYAELKEFACLDRMPGGIVLTGGEAELPGIVDIMEEYLNVPVRLGLPENLRGIPTENNRAQNAAVIGGLIYAARKLDLNYESSQSVFGIFNKIRFWFKDLFS